MARIPYHDAISFRYGFGMPDKNLCNTVKENNKTDIKTNNNKDLFLRF